MKRCILAAAILAAGLWQSAGHAASYDETTGGDLSDDRLAPSFLALSEGGNSVFGSSGSPDLDYLALSVPAGHRLTALVVGPRSEWIGGSSFIAVQAGPVMTVPNTTGSAAELLGWRHFGFGDESRDILDDMGTSFGAIGFTAPLASGTYTFWIQETASGAGSFDFDFQVSAVPEANTALALATGLMLLGLTFARRRD